MSLLHACHFDAGVFKPDFTYSGALVSTTYARTGSRSAKIPGDYPDHVKWLQLNLASAESEIYLQYAYYITGTLTHYLQNLVLYGDAGTVLLVAMLSNATQKLNFYLGNEATFIGSTSLHIPLNKWAVIEVHARIADSGGIIEVRKDCVPVLTYSGDTKVAGSDVGIKRIRWGCSGFLDQYIDDLIVNDPDGSSFDSWPSGDRVFYSIPAADSTPLQWTPEPGPGHYSAVDEAPPSGTDYLEAQSSGLEDRLTLTSLPGDAKQVKAVIPEAYALKGSANPPTRIALGIALGENEKYSDAKDLQLVESVISDIMEERPGGGAWAVDDFEDAQLIIKSAD